MDLALQRIFQVVRSKLKIPILYTHFSRKASKLCWTVSPTISTTLGTARSIGFFGRFRSVPRTPTISSSGKPSSSLRAPWLSEGGPLGREDDRCRPPRCADGVAAWFPAAAAARSRSRWSEFSTASTREDIMLLKMQLTLVVGRFGEWMRRCGICG